MIGSKNPLWKGGITPVNRAIRMSFEMKQWRVAVFKRDDYRCLDCGIKGGDIHADHIYPFAYFPRLRFDLNNGRTLCVECHRRTPTYGNRKVQYAE
jgi:5-methylcytosine-specific restriction endonuclease McrA